MADRSFLSALVGAVVPRAKAAPPAPVSENRGGWYRVFESFSGAFQHNVTVDRNEILAYHAVFACMTLIASDISKLRVKLVEQDADGIWTEVNTVSPYANVLRKPNRMQTRIQFWETWILSKLSRGNTYVLKERDARGIVTALYVLDPNRCKPMLTDDGETFYQLSADNVAGLLQDVMVPASEIIHDRFNCLFHPLVGTSPLFANGVAATQGLAIQNGATHFFNNRSQPGGMLLAPGNISDETAARLKTAWEANFTGENAGRIAVLGDGLTYQPIMVTAKDSQLIEQLKWTAEVVCSTFHVPPYKVGVGGQPASSSVQQLNLEYYTQCLQSLIEAAEICLDEGLGIGAGVKVSDGRTYGTEFDIDNLLRMDSIAQYEALEKAKSVLTLDERRRKVDMKKLPTGGATVYLQQQDHSIEAIAARDKMLIEQSEHPQPNIPEPANDPTPDDSAANDNTPEARAQRSAYRQMRMKRLVETTHAPVIEA